jgi:hypothetical protein
VVLVPPALQTPGPTLFLALHLQPARKLERQTSAAAHVCTTNSGRLFITDKVSKCRFLIDTGSDLCVFPLKLISQRRTGVNYDLCTANGTTISTCGWLPLSLNLGLRRDFAWRFAVADVTQPLIGAAAASSSGGERKRCSYLCAADLPLCLPTGSDQPTH